MRIEGTYTLPASAEQVCAALLAPDVLVGIIPGCERVIQLGPPSDACVVALELRLMARGPAATEAHTLAVTLTPASQPLHVDVQARGVGADRHVTAHGRIDLVERDGHTIVAYVCDVEASDGARLHDQWTAQAGQSGAQVLGARLSELLHAQQSGASRAAAPALAATTATQQGNIIVLTLSPRAPERRWMQRALWMGSGMVAGLSAIGLLLAAVHWIAERGETR